MLDSFRHWLGRDLIPRTGTPEEQAAAVWTAPFVVVSHGTEADPVLNYGNAAALALWETDLATLTRTPSRLTAEPVHRDERAELMERTRRDGFIADYAGVRVSFTGKRFLIRDAVVWNLRDAAGNYVGQAATFADWRFLS
jgi:hypothetical protein